MLSCRGDLLGRPYKPSQRMSSTSKPILSIIGAGKVGNTLARLCFNSGYTIDSIYSRTEEHARLLASQVNAVAVFTAEDAVTNADLILLTVPDDAISQTAELLTGANWTDKGVIHTSGAHDASALRALADRGAMAGSLHPAFPFADVETAMVTLAGTTFAVEATDERLRGWLYQMVSDLQGTALAITPGQKALYHAALVIASNYTVTLYAAAERLLMSLGADKATADQALNGLVAATVVNLQRQGIPDALTGPLVRADTGTIQAHLEALRSADVALAEIYKALARLSFPMLDARGIPTQAIKRLLEQEDHHAVDHP
jgi:predicted short-subunit dehydrogenase-like oxidoreductase (DUF2520 family)